MRIIPAYAGSTGVISDGFSAAWDHPRIRGEHVNVGPPSLAGVGSSPHTRGARGVVHRRRRPVRIIPAYAGSTPSEPSGRDPGPDHPRIRGEHREFSCHNEGDSGSSPHTRGARPGDDGRPCSRWDHPRIRGEHTGDITANDFVAGSSPHTRGARFEFGDDHLVDGIIPAYAGSTRFWQFLATRSRDHPRIRGEHSICLKFCHLTTGSSPHTRGARTFPDRGEARQRIIPAYAGSTCLWPGNIEPHRDHPRIRGEHGGCQAILVDSDGSSPHTRGAPHEGVHVARRSRIIPAYAGSTSSYPTCELPRTDHPRIRGEHLMTSANITVQGGSSPHTRGALALLGDFRFHLRIIPAYAGSTP